MSAEDLPKEGEEYMDILPFQELIGCFWWLAQMTRPDIFVALQKASQWVNKPTPKLWRWLTRIAKYLAGTRTLGLVFKRNAVAPPLEAYFDAAFAEGPDCKSTSGWAYFIHGALIAYDSTTIKRVVTSSTEAECAALTTIGKENSWQRQIYQELYGLNQIPPTGVHGDNTASISLLSSGVTKRSRHFAIEWFKVKDLVENGEMQVQWVPTDQNPADFFTKKLAKDKFVIFRDLLMGNDKLQNHFVPLMRHEPSVILAPN